MTRDEARKLNLDLRQKNPPVPFEQISELTGVPTSTLCDWAKQDLPPELSRTVKPKKATYKEDGNEATVISAPSSEQPTVDKLLHDFNVDTDVWEVDSFTINEWTTPYKAPDGGMNHITNYQAKARLIRKVPVKFKWPTVQGATVKPLKSRAFNISRRMKRLFVYSDGQVGYRRDLITKEQTPTHDEAAFFIAGSMIDSLEPDWVIDLGDALDMPDQSTHWKQREEFARTTQDALNWYASWLNEHRRHTGDWDIIEGNHDARLVDNVSENARSAYALHRANLPDEPPVYSIPFLLGLKQMEIGYVGPYPEGQIWVNDDLACVHGEYAASKPGQTAQKYLEDARCSIIAGHAHRHEIAHKTVHRRGGPVMYGAYICGCLCRVDGIVPARTPRPNWSQSILVVDYTKDLFHVQPVNIFGGRAVFDGRTWTA